MTIRPAELRDLESLHAIYAHEVRTGTATFDLEPPSADAWRAWFDAHGSAQHPLVVAVRSLEERGERVVGYACLSPYRPHAAFAPTVELSVYLSADERGCGTGHALAQHVIDLARACPLTHRVVSVVTVGNEASERLHRRLGFAHCGTLHEVGRKFDSWHSVATWELPVEQSMAATEPS
ncbi:N-acetyltransferase [Berryella wangjianweii]|uniref:N-acetyltransferase n=1 Tax=Berryella wangjianweii TaxID=2734634 RepID=A0A6M8IX91_9ACTN|nr:GNAT family N-acetyltransferase [Berryella wangjianweii]QKF07385.1 N-acetyltransferase [Berryella wangjianweii]